MAHFLKNGNSFRVFAQESIDLTNKLAPGNYVVKMDQYENLFIEQVDDFEVKGKLYGDVGKNADRILNTFDQRPNATELCSQARRVLVRRFFRR